MMGKHDPVAFANLGALGAPGKATILEKKLQCGKKKRRSASPQMRHDGGVPRRVFIKYLSFSSLILGSGSAAQSAKALSPRFATPEDLTKRLRARITKEPEPRLYQSDIFYPEYFAGLWRTESSLLAVECPAGYKLFGNPGTFEAAQEEVDKPLVYKSRFIHSGNSAVSDRPFNVASFAKASLGASSVLDCSAVGSSPNRLVMTLRPTVSEGAVFNVDLRVIGRQQQMGTVPRNVERRFGAVRRETVEGDKVQETDSEVGLYTSETTRQEVRLNTDDLRVTPLIKDIETIAVFVTEAQNENCIQGWQKTSVYLAKSDLRYPDARGRPVDVRWYRIKHLRA